MNKRAEDGETGSLETGVRSKENVRFSNKHIETTQFPMRPTTKRETANKNMVLSKAATLSFGSL